MRCLSAELPWGGSNATRAGAEAALLQLQPAPLAPGHRWRWRPLAVPSAAGINIRRNSAKLTSHNPQRQPSLTLAIHFYSSIASRKSVAKTPRKKLCWLSWCPWTAFTCVILWHCGKWSHNTYAAAGALFDRKQNNPQKYEQILIKFSERSKEQMILMMFRNLIYSTKTATGFVHKAPYNGVQPCCLYFTVCTLY